MTRTEDRLSEALTARASAVSGESLRPLTAGEGGRRADATPPGSPPVNVAGQVASGRWRRILIPLSAAAAVAALIGLVFGAGQIARTQFGRPFANAGSAHAPPPYLVTIDGADDIQVQATATGKVTDRVRPPTALQFTNTDHTAVLAAPDRTGRFAIAYGGRAAPIQIFTFRLTRIGRVTEFGEIRGGVVDKLVGYRLAITADGTKVAIAGSPERPYGARPTPRIIVIHTATGRHQTWRGGLVRPDSQMSILSLSWRGGDTRLVFAAQWCKPVQAEPYSYQCAGSRKDPPSWAVAQVRELAATGAGGTLAASRVLLSFPGPRRALAQAIMSGNENSVLVLLVGARYSIERIALPGSHGRPARLSAGQGHWSDQPDFLSTDSSGRYLLIGLDDGTRFGWIGRGGFHRLPDLNGQLTSAAW